MVNTRPLIVLIAGAALIALVFGVFAVGFSARQSSSATEADAATPVSSAFPDGPVVGFYGDSYTLGTGASDPSRRWSTVISTDRGWNEFNPSVNGLGFINNRSTFGDGDLPDLVIKQHPDIVFVTMGLNDNFSFSQRSSEIKSQIAADFMRIKASLPDARIIAVEPFWYTDDRPDSLDTISGWVRDEASAIDADYISGASHWIEGHPEWMAADGLHPNDDGYAAMTQRMDAELTKLGL